VDMRDENEHDYRTCSDGQCKHATCRRRIRNEWAQQQGGKL
jgi:hypothetical protein